MPKRWDHVQSACLFVTAGTAYEALFQHLEIKQDEQVGILIITGAGGVGSMASQMARRVLNLPVVICTAGRPETVEWCKKMGATHVINHHEDLQSQINKLELKVPIKSVLSLSYCWGATFANLHQILLHHPLHSQIPQNRLRDHGSSRESLLRRTGTCGVLRHAVHFQVVDHVLVLVGHETLS